MSYRPSVFFAALFLLLAIAAPHSSHAALITTGGGDCYNTVTHVITPGACPAGSGESTTMKTQAAFSSTTSAANMALNDQISAGGDASNESTKGATGSTPDVAYCDSSECYNTAGTVVGSCNSVSKVCYAGYPGAEKACDSSECDHPGSSDQIYKTGYQSATMTEAMKTAQTNQMTTTSFQILGIATALPGATNKASQQMVRPKQAPSLYDYVLSVTSHYGRSNFSASGSGSDGHRGEQNTGFTIKGGVSTDDWGVNVTVPVQRSISDGTYSATNNTSYGLAVTPVYHLLREPLHGLSLNLGAVLGYGYQNYDDLNKLNDPMGPLGLSNYKDDENIQMGAFFKAAQHLRANTVLSFGASYVDHHAFMNTDEIGHDNAVTTVDMGYLYKLSNTSSFTTDLKMIHVSQYSLDASTTYGQADIGFRQMLDKDTSLRAKITHSFGNNNWTTTDGLLSLVWTGM